MDKSLNPPHILMDTSSTIPTQVSQQTSTTVSLDTDALIAAHQGAAWKISGWPENITIHHAKGCACCHKYINHLLGAQSLRQINLQCLDVENTVQSTWPTFINHLLGAQSLRQINLQRLNVENTVQSAWPTFINSIAIAFHSHTFTPLKLNYNVHDKELLTIFEAFKIWCHYLEGSLIPIDMVTDHKNLEYFSTTKLLTHRQVFWSESLCQFNLTIHFHPGHLGTKPNVLTR